MRLKILSLIMLTLLFGSMFLPAIKQVKGEPATHDLEVSWSKSPPLQHVSSGGSAALNATIKNKGDVTENNVNLLLLINGTVYLNSTAKKLLPNGIFWTTYLWAPDDGIWNVTAYAPPVTEEGNVLNNAKTRLVKVCPDQPPVANFTYSPPPPSPGPIKGELVTFNASLSYDPDWGNITTYIWYFNSTWPTKQVSDPITTYPFPNYGKARVYLVLRDTENLYSDFAWKNLTVYARPVAGFNVSSKLYKGYPITFNASRPYSYDPDGTIKNYTWDFDDGNVTSVPDPVINHTYTPNGTYTVKLTVTDNDNLSNSWTRNITIEVSRPKAVFSITRPHLWPGPYYINETLTFDATNSTPGGGYITGYLWDFGDGTEGNGSVIPHNFTKPGIYNVILTVFDEKGSIDITSKLVRISVSMEIKPEKIVGNPPDGIISVNITIVSVEHLKKFAFNLTWAPHCDLLSYKNTTKGDFLNGGWNGSVTNGTCYVFATYTAQSGYERSGSGTLLTIRLKVLSSGNATLKLKDTILYNSTLQIINNSVKDGYFYTTKPVANFTYSPIPAVANISVTFDASSSYDPDNGTIVDYNWDFGDGNVTSVSDPVINHTYTEIKTFNVTLTVVDYDEPPENWSITKQVNVIVHDIAVISVSPWANRTGWILPINVTVRNEGGAFETVNVTLYYCNATGSYPIKTAVDIPGLKTENTANLAPFSEKTLTIIWNVTCVALGNYNIKAVACTVPYEKHTGDNNCTSALKVAVIWLGDLDADGDVDEDDLWHFCTNFIDYYKSGYKPDEMIFKDFNFDCKIDEDDLWKFCDGFIRYYKGQRC